MRKLALLSLLSSFDIPHKLRCRGDEFYDLLAADNDESSMPRPAFESSMFELVDVWADRPAEEWYIRFLRQLFDVITELQPWALRSNEKATPAEVAALEASEAMEVAEARRGRALAAQAAALDELALVLSKEGLTHDDAETEEVLAPALESAKVAVAAARQLAADAAAAATAAIDKAEATAL
eukprot:SAG11_NODE_12835_length_683_cov_0.797945_1_plen_181_part_10